MKVPEPERIALDHTAANLPVAMKALLNFDALHTYGYTDEQILEAVLIVGLECRRFRAGNGA